MRNAETQRVSVGAETVGLPGIRDRGEGTSEVGMIIWSATVLKMAFVNMARLCEADEDRRAIGFRPVPSD